MLQAPWIQADLKFDGSKDENHTSLRADLHGTTLSHATTAYDRPTT